jgi:hypothetical protein
MPTYGSTDTIISRQGATPESFGFGNETDPDQALQDFIDGLRDRASSEVEQYCDRVFDLQTGETETVTGNGTDTISVRNYPVVSINSITVGATTIDAGAYQIRSTPGNPIMNAGIIERTDRRVWPGRQITVDYDWGFEEPPGVVKTVVEDMVVETLEKARVDRQSDAKTSESMDGYSVSWDTSEVDTFLRLDESKRNRLEPLKRQGVA